MDLLKWNRLKNRRIEQAILAKLRHTRLGQAIEAVRLEGSVIHVLFRVTEWQTRARVYPLAARQILVYAQAVRDLDLPYTAVRFSGSYPMRNPRYADAVRLRVVVDAVYAAAIVRDTDWRVLDDADAWRLAARTTLDPTFAALT